MIRVKDLGNVTQIAQYRVGHTAELLWVKNEDVAGLAADLIEVVVAQVEARGDVQEVG